MPEEIAAYRGYLQWLIADLNCPCRTASPHPTACLNLNLDHDISAEITSMCRRPRARCSHRRRVVRGRSNETSDSDGPAGKFDEFVECKFCRRQNRPMG